MVPIGDPLYGLAGASRTLGGGGKEPRPTGPPQSTNGRDSIVSEVELALTLSRSTACWTRTDKWQNSQI